MVSAALGVLTIAWLTIVPDNAPLGVSHGRAKVHRSPRQRYALVDVSIR